MGGYSRATFGSSNNLIIVPPFCVLWEFGEGV